MLRKTHPDYLVRKMEELAKVLAKLLGFKENGDNHEIINLTEETFNELFGDDIPLHATNDLTNWLDKAGLSKDDLINLSDILFERAEALANESEDEKASSVYQQTQTCMNYTLEKHKVFPFHWASRMEYLKNKTQGL